MQTLRGVLPADSSDTEVLRYTNEHSLVLVTCNRRDFLPLAPRHLHQGIIIAIRRRTRAAECAALLSLPRRAGDTGVYGNLTFA